MGWYKITYKFFLFLTFKKYHNYFEALSSNKISLVIRDQTAIKTSFIKLKVLMGSMFKRHIYVASA